MKADPAAIALDFRDAAAFDAWLAEHHDTAAQAQLFLYKKGYRDQGLCYEDAVRTALCWGWIDSVTHRHDERRFVQRFGPRRAGSGWSASNVRRMVALLDEGRVRAAGLRCFDRSLIDRLPEIEAEEAARRGGPTELPPFARALVAAEPALVGRFDALPPSQRRMFVRWIGEARRPDTRERRVRKMMQLLREGRGPSAL